VGRVYSIRILLAMLIYTSLVMYSTV